MISNERGLLEFEGNVLINTGAAKGIALCHRDALVVYRGADLDWTYISPPALIRPGKRTGQYRIGTDLLLADEEGETRISVEDYAVVFVDEI